MDLGYEFKIPSMIPQDLLLIQDLIGDEIPVPTPTKIPIQVKGEEDSSDNDSDSEREVEANILDGMEDVDEGTGQPRPLPSGSTSDSDSSIESDSSENEEETKGAPSKTNPIAVDDDEELGPGITSESQTRTKNEVEETDIATPDIEEVSPDEGLEKVGEVMSIIDRVVIVKGTSSSIPNRGSERALDSDTLLVFDDRKVLGFIYETFGPTYQPLYQVRFNQNFPLDPEKVKVSREVFHVPARSKFVFVNQIKAFKGSDASNAHDEEPGDDELEFSDDEAERAHKRAIEHRRGDARASRQATPVAQPPDQDLSGDLYGASPYDHSLNDMDFGAGPSRPTPMPYDDPYSDSYGIENPPTASVSIPPPEDDQPRELPRTSNAPRGRGRGNGPMREFSGRQDRGRGRGRDRQQRPDRGRGRGRGGHRRNSEDTRRRGSFSSSSDQNPRTTRPVSPTSLAIARATGQYSDGTSYASAEHDQQNVPGYSPVSGLENGWSYPSYPVPQPSSFYDGDGGDYQMGFPQTQQYVEPHINPRFASAFGFGVGPMGFAGQSYGFDQHGGGEYDPSGDSGQGGWVPEHWTNSGGGPPHSSDAS